MKKLTTIVLASMLSISMAQAQMNCGAGKCGSSTERAKTQGMSCGAGKCGGSMNMNKGDSKLFSDMHNKNGFNVAMHSEKPLVVGNNEIKVVLKHDGKLVDNAKVKIKFFMPEMPGMPYMEYKTKLKYDDGGYKGTVNFSMSGTWQYQLKFKSNDGKVHKIRGSVNI